MDQEEKLAKKTLWNFVKLEADFVLILKTLITS